MGAQNGTLQSTPDFKRKCLKQTAKGFAKLSSLVIGLQSRINTMGFLMDAATAKAYAANNSNLYAFL